VQFYTQICTTGFKKSSSAELSMKIWFLACTMAMYFFIIFHYFHVWLYTTHNLSYIQTSKGSIFRTL